MPAPWWRDAVVYQVYLRSFADSDGDGVGDLRGVIDRLDHLAGLGVDALWLNPFYPSGGADGGYDITDHRAVDPVLGTLDDVDVLVTKAHRLGLRVVGDIVANHTSIRHPWFCAHPDRYHVVEGKHPPSDWESLFGGPAWSPLGEDRWYLHLFDVEQPDLNWDHPQVRTDAEQTLRFWLDRGFDGLRFDALGALSKPPFDADRLNGDRPEVHDIVRRFATILAEYPDRFGVAETWGSAEVTEPYLRPGEMQQAFAMDVVFTEPAGLGPVVRSYLDAANRQGRRPAWVHGNHDVTRAAGRWGREGSLAVLMLMLALPGATYLYAGDELALPEVELADEDLRDPSWKRSGGTFRGRDGARVPIPWTLDAAGNHGFSPPGADPPWLPQPPSWGSYGVESSAALEVVRRALAARARFRDAPDPEWVPGRDGVLRFRRGDLTCVFTPGPTVELGGEPLAASRELDDRGRLPAPGTAWLLDPVHEPRV